ncbi:MAG: hypothetical protein OH319_02100 [Candidatus Parvarchaeota archaeon]|nr:hypothetical protein [Candidatus Jingweiarchaeum tengchongense]MCW1298161.1 hypothetical protein [Candidatus Jingweiarchaeum tengchongense]MCW1299959.1 hypothetical protein [Candidatus Jingweiarchaeum tengchongense]MCW1305056.1 hypothetical protein [Candidatus Jingweiarchaeum tengchongense]MCW1305581.1 hypothetical protein [Candidatus Jingweiarchaeum tengchongense]
MPQAKKVLNQAASAMGTITLLIVTAVILIVMGLVFFLVNLWIIKFAAVDILKLQVSGEWIVFSAAVLSAASMIGSKSR